MLSNTATPRYYGEFKERVLSGQEPVCQEISMQMNRIERLIANPKMFYDDEAIDGFIRFCETELTLTDGSDLKLLDSFKLWAEDLLSWFYYEDVTTPITDGMGQTHYERRSEKRRLVNKQYLIVARGAAKSMYLSAIQNYFLNVDPATTQQITTAPTQKQADEVLSPIRTAIARSRGPLFKFLTDGSINNTTGSKMERCKLASTKDGIVNFLTESKLMVRSMSIDKLQGLRCKVATVDEWLSCDINEDVAGALEQSCSKNKDWIMVLTSSEGTVRSGVGDSIKMELEDILKGTYNNPHTSIWYYKLDSIDEVADPNMWKKANPNLGYTVSYETYQLDVERAEKVPSARNDILAKRFGIPTEGFTYYFTYEETIPYNKFECWGQACSMGADLSLGDDFCSFSFLFPNTNGSFRVKTLNYITSSTFEKLPSALRQKYTEFMKEGSLVVMEGTVLDMMSVYDDLNEYIDKNQYDVRSFGFDPYNARDFVEHWAAENGPYGIEKVQQGVKTESVPLGEIKKLMEDRAIAFDQQIMSFALGNAIALEDTNGNRKLMKKRRDAKIDAVASMLDAYVAYKLNKEAYM